MTKTHKPTAVRSSAARGMSAPASLSTHAAALWRRLTTEYDFGDTLGRVLLAEALTAWDRAQGAAELIARDGAVIVAPDGAMRRHPAVSIETNSRAQAVRIFRELGLNLEPVKPIGRPLGR